MPLERGRNRTASLRIGPGAQRTHALQPRSPAGERSRLVEHDAIGPRESLQRTPAGHEQTGTRQPRRGRGQRGGCRQRQCARAGHDQHREHAWEGARRIGMQPMQPHRGREHQHCTDEPRRRPIRQRDETRARGACMFEQPRNCRQRRVLAYTQHAHLDHAAEIQAAGDQRIVRAAHLRCGFPGQQRLIDLGGAGQHFPVGRNALAGQDAHAISRDQFLRQHSLRSLAHDTQHAVGEHARERILLQPGTMAQRHFGEATQPQEEREHHDRVEVHRSAATQHGNDAPQIRTADRQRHRDIHPERARAQGSPGTVIERPRRIECHRGSHDQAHEAQQLLDVRRNPLHGAGIERDRIGHHFHHAEAGHRQPLERIAALRGAIRPAGAEAQWVRLKSQRIDALEHAAQRDASRLIAQLGAAGSRTHVHRADAGEPAQAVFDEPAAGGAVQAVDLQAQFAFAVGAQVSEATQ